MNIPNLASQFCSFYTLNPRQETFIGTSLRTPLNLSIQYVAVMLEEGFQGVLNSSPVQYAAMMLEEGFQGDLNSTPPQSLGRL